MNTKLPISYYFILFSFLIGIRCSVASELPPDWPWHGVGIENIDFSPEKINKVFNTININSVQLRLRPRMLAKKRQLSSSEAWKQSLIWADALLDICKSKNIVAILTVEGFPIDPKIKYNHTSPNFWFNSKAPDQVVKLASKLSKHFAQRGAELAAYQLLSEPVVLVAGKSVSPPQWDLFTIDLINAIRKNDPERWIAVAPAPWGLPSSYQNFKLLPFQNIIYGAHMYSPHSYTHQGIRKYTQRYTYPGIINKKAWDRKQLMLAMSELRNFQMKHQVPVWIGEFSAIRWAPGAEQYIKDLVSIFNQYNWSWTYFNLNGWHGWNPDYNEKQPLDNNWKSHNIGKNSKRWETLKYLFNTPNNQKIKLN